MHTQRKLLSSLAAVAIFTSLSGAARASENFPAALQAAAGMPCAPSCVICHGVDPGTAATFMNKALGKALFNQDAHVAAPKDAAGLTTNFNAYASKPENAANVALIKQGIDPETGANLCEGGVTYGCGARVAKSSPQDDWSGLLYAAGAMVFGAILRRTKSRPTAR